MRTHVLFSPLRHASLAGFLLLAIGQDVCVLPFHGQGHLSEGAVSAPGLPGRSEAQVSSCEGSAIKPSAPGEVTPDPMRAPAETDTAPVSPILPPATS